VGEEVRGRWGVGAGAEEAQGGRQGRPEPGGTGEARGDRQGAGGAPGVRDAKDPRCAGALRGTGGERDGGAPDPARAGTGGGVADADGARAPAEALRKGESKSLVAIRHLHVSAAQARAAVHGGHHGRPQPLHRELRDSAPPEVVPRDGGAEEGGGRVRVPEGDPDGPGTSVHGVEGRDGLRAGAAEPGHPAREESPAAPDDAGQAGEMVEDAVAGIPLAHALHGSRRLHPSDEPVRGLVQLQASAPGPGWPGARGPLLPRGAARARGAGEERAGQRAGARAPAPGAQALLPGGPLGGQGPHHLRPGRRGARADGPRATHHHQHR